MTQDKLGTYVVSVVMPVYNAERYLREAVESILNQTFTDFEFIAIDDGSTDNSRRILERYAQKDPRLRVVSRENRGITPTLNEGIALAQGEYIARMDADDVALPERFEGQVAFLCEHPEVAVVGTWRESIDKKGRQLSVEKTTRLGHEEILALLLECDCCISHPTVMFRADVIQKLGGYDETYRAAQDYDLWLRVALEHRLAVLPEVLMKYRVHDETISSKRWEVQREAAENACNRARALRGMPSNIVKEPHRPVDKKSKCRKALRWGWDGFMRGDRRMALDYGVAALLQRPVEMNAWRLLICALIKPLPKAAAGCK